MVHFVLFGSTPRSLGHPVSSSWASRQYREGVPTQSLCLKLNQTLGDHFCQFCATIVPAFFVDRTDCRQDRGFLAGLISVLLFPKPAVYLPGPMRLECRGESSMHAPNLTSPFSMSYVNVVFGHRVLSVSLQRAISHRLSIVYLGFSMATLVQLN